MAQAQQEFSTWLDAIEFHPPTVPLIFNVTAATETDPQKIRQLVARNLVEPVCWRTAMDSLRCAGRTCIVRDRAGARVVRAGAGEWFGRRDVKYSTSTICAGLKWPRVLANLPPCHQKTFHTPARPVTKPAQINRLAAGSSCAWRMTATARSIYRMRHEVYAAELGQHSPNAAGRLTDSLDAFNHYIVAADGDRIVGFVSITPPGGPGYSVDKYFKRGELPFPVDDKLYEIRLLTVPQASRRSMLASALMYAAFRWSEARGGTRIVAIGRKEIRNIHLRVGLKPTGQDVQSGAVTYGLLHGTMADIHAALPGVRPILDRVKTEMSWRIGVAYDTPATCYHGGKFFEAVGDEFQTLERLDSVINADVLDAWFPPSPKAIAAIEQHLPQILRTSPPTGCEGLIRTIARVRGVRPECILPGAGSSDLIFLALRHWLTPASRVLILDPTYGEYAHILERVVGCRVERLPLQRAEQYRLDPGRLELSSGRRIRPRRAGQSEQPDRPACSARRTGGRLAQGAPGHARLGG